MAKKQRLYDKYCKECGNSFIAHRKDKEFCCKSCSNSFNYSKKINDEYGDTNTVVRKDVNFPDMNHSPETDIEWTIKFIELNTNLSRFEAQQVIKKTFDYIVGQPPIDGIRGVKIGEIVRLQGKEALVDFCNKVLKTC